ncbi:MAG TPA: PspC domain-containing protein [Rhodanobacteraceae bacterium]|jgi:phage shock protein PspC (stress-responsive transcriptional regulator)
MQIVTHVSLSGHSTPFQLDEEGYQSLRSYFARARSRLKRDPDRDEILHDLEQSIGEKFVALLHSRERIIGAVEVDAVLRQVGTVDLDNGNSAPRPTQPFRPRRLCRILEGKWFSGVCVGLAAYSSIDVNWVRAIFVLATIFTSGVVILVYLALMFALPVVQTHDEYETTLHASSPAL